MQGLVLTSATTAGPADPPWRSRTSTEAGKLIVYSEVATEIAPARTTFGRPLRPGALDNPTRRREGNPRPDFPMAVIIDRGSASARDPERGVLTTAARC